MQDTTARSLDSQSLQYLQDLLFGKSRSGCLQHRLQVAFPFVGSWEANIAQRPVAVDHPRAIGSNHLPNQQL
jgi:hypothetical protein